MGHTNPISLLDSKRSTLLANKYRPKIIIAKPYTDTVARWPTAVLKSEPG